MRLNVSTANVLNMQVLYLLLLLLLAAPSSANSSTDTTTRSTTTSTSTVTSTRTIKATGGYGAPTPTATDTNSNNGVDIPDCPECRNLIYSSLCPNPFPTGVPNPTTTSSSSTSTSSDSFQVHIDPYDFGCLCGVYTLYIFGLSLCVGNETVSCSPWQSALTNEEDWIDVQCAAYRSAGGIVRINGTAWPSSAIATTTTGLPTAAGLNGGQDQLHGQGQSGSAADAGDKKNIAIGVGIGAGVCVLVAGAWFLIRILRNRKRKRALTETAMLQRLSEVEGKPLGERFEAGNEGQKFEVLGDTGHEVEGQEVVIPGVGQRKDAGPLVELEG